MFFTWLHQRIVRHYFSLDQPTLLQRFMSLCYTAPILKAMPKEMLKTEKDLPPNTFTLYVYSVVVIYFLRKPCRDSFQYIFLDDTPTFLLFLNPM